MTNFEKIKQMSIEEMAEMLFSARKQGAFAFSMGLFTNQMTLEDMKLIDWLESDVHDVD